MLKIALTSILFLSCITAFASNKTLCESKATKAVSNLYKKTTQGKQHVKKRELVYYSSYTNLNGESIVQYEFKVQTNKGPSFARVRLSQNKCSLIAGNIYSQPHKIDVLEHKEVVAESINTTNE